MLSPRTEVVLKTIIEEYIKTAEAVSSQDVLAKSGLQVSAATIRNEMASLAEQGYIIRPHYASGSVPSDRGYRYYVNTLKDISLSEEEQRLLNHLFYQVEQDLEQWLDLAVRFLSQQTQVMSLATPPHTASSRFKHLELIELRERLVLMILVLWSTRVMRELLHLKRGVDQAGLTVIADRLNQLYSGMNRHEIESCQAELSEEEQMITRSILRLMELEDLAGDSEPYLDGWAFLLSQPEFSHPEQLARLMDLIERRQLLRVILPTISTDRRLNVIIGGEQEGVPIKGYSMIIGRYGHPGEPSGYIGVIGPTRLSYERAIATVDGVATALDKLLGTIYEERT